MNIKDLVKLWNESKYKSLMIQYIACVRDDKEIVKPTGTYYKGEIIPFGGDIPVDEYLIKIYGDSIFFIENAAGNMIYAYEIYRKKDDVTIKDLKGDE